MNVRCLAVVFWLACLAAPPARAAVAFDAVVFRTGFEVFVCPDGRVEDAETCDDGAAAPGDGCSAQCAIEFGHYCSGQPSACTTLCADGARAAGEACDDGGLVVGDGCDAQCQVETGFQCSGTPSVCTTVCGDGVVAGGEACDDDDTDNGDGCSDQCGIEPGYLCTGAPSLCSTLCGDGLVAGGEACDDDDTENGDGCSDQCGVEPGFQCTGTPSVCSAVCGDGFVAPGEGCDDDEVLDGDGCSAQCTVEPGFACSGAPSVCSTICGDGIPAGPETCDDGNAENGDGCTNACMVGAPCRASDRPGADRLFFDAATRRCYAAYDDDMTTFNGAKAACSAAGGHLATITDAAEAQSVAMVQHPLQNPWIGASEDAETNDDTFVWVTGEFFGYRRFAAGQPDNDAGSGGNGDCLHLLNADGEWNDTACTLETFVVGRICEFEP